FLLRMLAQADAILASRRAALARYREGIAALDDPRVHLWEPPLGVEGNGYLAVVTVDGVPGEALARGLTERGIGCARTYPETLDVQPPTAGADRACDFAVSRRFCESVVN